jgi:hypothetical protein
MSGNMFLFTHVPFFQLFSIHRTHPNLQFFLEPEDNIGQRRYAAIERILFVWAKLNRGVSYSLFSTPHYRNV